MLLLLSILDRLLGIALNASSDVSGLAWTLEETGVRLRDLRGDRRAAWPACAAGLSWPAEHHRYRITVFPRSRCPARRKSLFQRDASEYLATVLRMYGAAIGDYIEDDLIESHTAPG